MILDRSLEDRTLISTSTPLTYESRLITLEWLADGGYFRNNRKMIVNWRWPSIARLFRVNRSMINLEKMSLLKWELTLTEDLARLFQSCPKLTELHLRLRDILFEHQKLEMGEKLENELRSGCQRLRLFELVWDIDSWPAIQKIFT